MDRNQTCRAIWTLTCQPHLLFLRHNIDAQREEHSCMKLTRHSCSPTLM